MTLKELLDINEESFKLSILKNLPDNIDVDIINRSFVEGAEVAASQLEAAFGYYEAREIFDMLNTDITSSRPAGA